MVAKGHGTLSLTLLYSLAGTAGFEPANDGTKTRCLTTWRRSINVIIILSQILAVVNLNAAVFETSLNRTVIEC